MQDDVVERIRSRVHDAPMPSEYLLDEAAATILSLRDRLEKAEGALREIEAIPNYRCCAADMRKAARAYFAAQEPTP